MKFHSRTPLGVHSTALAPGQKGLKDNLVLGGAGGNSANTSLANVPSRQGNAEVHPMVSEYLNSGVPTPPNGNY